MEEIKNNLKEKKKKSLRFSSKLKRDIAYNKGVIELSEGAENITIVNFVSALADPILSRFYQGASLYNSTINQFYKRTMRYSVIHEGKRTFFDLSKIIIANGKGRHWRVKSEFVEDVKQVCFSWQQQEAEELYGVKRSLVMVGYHTKRQEFYLTKFQISETDCTISVDLPPKWSYSRVFFWAFWIEENNGNVSHSKSQFMRLM